MNLSENLNTSLIDSNGLLPLKTRCNYEFNKLGCCFYLFCCCFCFKDTHVLKKLYLDLHEILLYR